MAYPSLTCPNRCIAWIRCPIQSRSRQRPSSHRNSMISTAWPSAVVLVQVPLKPLPRPSCLICDPASCPVAVHPSAPRLSWLFPAPTRQFAEFPLSHSNRLDSIFRRSQAFSSRGGLTMHRHDPGPTLTASLSDFPALNVGDVDAHNHPLFLPPSAGLPAVACRAAVPPPSPSTRPAPPRARAWPEAGRRRDVRGGRPPLGYRPRQGGHRDDRPGHRGPAQARP